MSCYNRGYWDSWPRQAQNQTAIQSPEAEADQDQKTIFKEIGNVHIDINNENILVAVLVLVAVLTGTLDGAGVQALLSRFFGGFGGQPAPR